MSHRVSLLLAGCCVTNHTPAIARLTALAALPNRKVTTVDSEREDFDTFFRRVYESTVALLRKVGFGKDDSEEAVQDAMATAYKAWASIHRPDAWVKTVAIRRALRLKKRREDDEVIWGRYVRNHQKAVRIEDLVSRA